MFYIVKKIRFLNLLIFVSKEEESFGRGILFVVSIYVGGGVFLVGLVF